MIQLKVYIFWRDDWSMDRKRQMDRESNEIAMEMKFFRPTDIVLDRPLKKFIFKDTRLNENKIR